MKTQKPITEVNGYPLAEGWYEEVVINDAAAEVAALHVSWGTADKDRGEECGRCRGRGYTRKDGNVGCDVCGGCGVVSGVSGAGADERGI